MAIASTRTILPLDTFAKQIGISPLHFNQVVINEEDATTGRRLAPATTCGQPFIQNSYQFADRVGREDIALAIREAEGILAEQLKYQIGPTWTKDDRRDLNRPSNPALFSLTGLNNRGMWSSVKARWGYVIGGGIESVSLIEANSPVVYTDTDGDGYKETATVTFNTTVTDEQELSLYYPGHSGQAEWEIRPLASRSILAGVATLVCTRQQLVIESAIFTLSPTEVNGLDDAKFLTVVDVYQHYNDPSQQVRFIWENVGGNWDLFWPCGGCGDSSCNYCVQNTQTGCLSLRTQRQGIVSVAPAVWNSTDSEFNGAFWRNCRQPDHADIWYRNGWVWREAQWTMLDIDPIWARAVSFLALSLLNRPMCNCDNLNAYQQHWRDDLANTGVSPSGGSSSFKISPSILENPIGTTRAAISAWQHVVRNRLGEAVDNA